MNATIKKLQEKGLTHESHHAQIKSAYKEITGQVLSKDDLASIRAMLEEAKPAKKARAQKVALEPKEAMIRAREIVKERQDAEEAGWENVTKVVEAGADGKPNRVEIKCADPQEQGGESVCVKTREIASQDVFQVHRCEPCQKRANVIKRNEDSKAKRAAAKKIHEKGKGLKAPLVNRK